MSAHVLAAFIGQARCNCTPSTTAGVHGRRNGATRQASDAETVLRDTRSMEQLRTAADWQLERAYAKVLKFSGKN